MCFADGRVTADKSAVGMQGVLAVNRGEPFRLNGTEPVSLSASMRYEVVKADGGRGPFKVSTRGWIYHLYGPRNRRLIGYHWHPVSDSHATRPHLHAFEMGDKKHYPTGRILFEDVLDLAIEYGARPRDREALGGRVGREPRDVRTWGYLGSRPGAADGFTASAT